MKNLIKISRDFKTNLCWRNPESAGSNSQSIEITSVTNSVTKALMELKNTTAKEAYGLAVNAQLKHYKNKSINHVEIGDHVSLDDGVLKISKEKLVEENTAKNSEKVVFNTDTEKEKTSEEIVAEMIAKQTQFKLPAKEKINEMLGSENFDRNVSEASQENSEDKKIKAEAAKEVLSAVREGLIMKYFELFQYEEFRNSLGNYIKETDKKYDNDELGNKEVMKEEIKLLINFLEEQKKEIDNNPEKYRNYEKEEKQIKAENFYRRNYEKAFREIYSPKLIQKYGKNWESLLKNGETDKLRKQFNKDLSEWKKEINYDEGAFFLKRRSDAEFFLKNNPELEGYDSHGLVEAYTAADLMKNNHPIIYKILDSTLSF